MLLILIAAIIGGAFYYNIQGMKNKEIKSKLEKINSIEDLSEFEKKVISIFLPICSLLRDDILDVTGKKKKAKKNEAVTEEKEN
jgi:H+/gluconate symporter-like permease